LKGLTGLAGLIGGMKFCMFGRGIGFYSGNYCIGLSGAKRGGRGLGLWNINGLAKGGSGGRLENPGPFRMFMIS